MVEVAAQPCIHELLQQLVVVTLQLLLEQCCQTLEIPAPLSAATQSQTLSPLRSSRSTTPKLYTSALPVMGRPTVQHSGAM
uniref:Uncharacterized protein n=1 Tax=Oryza brachyantha TaxID=4533 RepID=J3M266_ORYBR